MKSYGGESAAIGPPALVMSVRAVGDIALRSGEVLAEVRPRHPLRAHRREPRNLMPPRRQQQETARSPRSRRRRISPRVLLRGASRPLRSGSLDHWRRAPKAGTASGSAAAHEGLERRELRAQVGLDLVEPPVAAVDLSWSDWIRWSSAVSCVASTPPVPSSGRSALVRSSANARGTRQSRRTAPATAVDRCPTAPRSLASSSLSVPSFWWRDRRSTGSRIAARSRERLDTTS